MVVATLPATDDSPLAANGQYQRAQSVTIPASTAPGAYRLLFVADGGHAVTEVDEANNVASVPLTVRAPDLVPTSLAAPDSPTISESIRITWRVENQGAFAALGAWRDSIYLSADATLDPTDGLLGSVEHSQDSPVANGDGYSRQLDVTIPNVTPGNWYLLVKTDSLGAQGETDESNNTIARAIQITATDLHPTNFQTPVGANIGATFPVQWTVKNLGPGPAPNNWSDAVWLSTDDHWDVGDFQLTAVTIDDQTPLAANASYTVSATPRVPNVAPGAWYLLIFADASRSQGETDESNNVLAEPFAVSGPDLVPSSLDAPANSSFGASIQRRMSHWPTRARTTLPPNSICPRTICWRPATTSCSSK